MKDFDRPNAGSGHGQHRPAHSLRALEFQHSGETSSRQSGFIEKVSAEALAAVMLRKGLCTEAELLEEEKRRRAESGSIQESQYVQINHEDVNAEQWDRPQHPLRKLFARYRWSRRLGTAIFGWKWKKLKKDHTPERVN